MCVCVCVTWVAHWRVQQVHGRAAQPQAVDAVGGLFEVGHHATGGQCSTQLRPVVRFPPMLQLDGTGGRTKSLHGHTHTNKHGYLPRGIKRVLFARRLKTHFCNFTEKPGFVNPAIKINPPCLDLYHTGRGSLSSDEVLICRGGETRNNKNSVRLTLTLTALFDATN